MPLSLSSNSIFLLYTIVKKIPDAASELINDVTFQHPTFLYASSQAKQYPVFKYRFETMLKSSEHLGLGVFHSGDL